MADAIFTHPRLAALYDVLDSDRSDLEHYVDIIAEFNARTVLDVGCGTGCLALLLAARDVDVVAVDPAAASLDVARAKPDAERVRWILGDARLLPPTQVDLATMTGNVAQAIVEPDDWTATLTAIHAALRPGGRLVFETRDPARQGWLEWTRAATHRRSDLPGVGVVEDWVDLIEVTGELVTFRWTYVFAADGAVLTSDSTLRFRRRAEVEATLTAAGFVVDEVRDAPDRPGREFVFIARRALPTRE